MRGYPEDCTPHGENWNVFYTEGQGARRWHFGTGMLGPFAMTAGETRDVWIEMDYQNRDMAKDFSIVAWGHDGALSLTNNAGLESMNFNDIPDEDAATL